MDIGKEKEKITVEPIKSPVPNRDTPAPQEQPTPVEPKKEPVKV